MLDYNNTIHAKNRYSERTDVSKNSTKHNTKYAYKNGTPISKFTGDFYNYLFFKQRHNSRVSVKVYNNNVYIFDNINKKLITVYPVPEKFLPVEQYKIKQGQNCKIIVNGCFTVPIIFNTRQAAHNYIRNNKNFVGVKFKIVNI